jgi:hypothetical protein
MRVGKQQESNQWHGHVAGGVGCEQHGSSRQRGKRPVAGETAGGVGMYPAARGCSLWRGKYWRRGKPASGGEVVRSAGKKPVAGEESGSRGSSRRRGDVSGGTGM